MLLFITYYNQFPSQKAFIGHNDCEHPVYKSLPTGYFCLFLFSADFFEINFYKKFFQEYHQSVKQLRSGLILIQTVCNSYQQMTLVGKELTLICLLVLLLLCTIAWYVFNHYADIIHHQQYCSFIIGRQVWEQKYFIH